MQRKTDYHAILGLTPNATAADVESAYHAISQHLDPQKQPAHLRRWAEWQLALADEAYAALTEGADEEVDVKPTPSARQNATAATHGGPGRAAPAAATVSRRPATHDDEEYEDEDDYDDLEDEYVVERPPERRASETPAKPGRALDPAPPHASATKAGQGRGRNRNRGRSRPGGQAYRQPVVEPDDRVRKLLLGLGAGVVVVLLAYFVVQSGIGPFGSSNAGNTGGSQSAGQQPAKLDQARYDQLKAVAQKDPQNFDVLFELGEMTFEADRFDESINWLEQAVQIKPNDVQSLQDIGTANFNLGNRDKALQWWQRALDADPNDGQTHWNLSFYYATAQPPDLDAAMREWQKVVELAPGSDLAKTAQQHIDSYKSRLAGGAAVPTPQR